MTTWRGNPALMVLAVAAVLLVPLVAIMPAVAGPITTSTALPIHEGEIIVRGQAKLTRASGDRSAMDRELTAWVVPTVVVYGVTEKLALFGILPYLDKKLRLTTPAGRLSRGDSGIGDFTFFARHSIAQWDKRGETLRLAPFGGLEVPSGKDNERDSLGRLPQPLQLGSGSWDPFVGVIFTWQTLAWEFDSSASYKFNTRANDFEFGDVARLDLSFQYRLWPRPLVEGIPAFVYAVVESNVIWQDENRISGSNDPNSGGTTWFLAPGIQYISRRLIAEVAIQLPAVQELNGSAIETDFVLTGGLRASF